MGHLSVPQRLQLIAYVCLLLVLSLCAWSFLAVVIDEFVNGVKGDEFTGNIQFLVVFGGPPLVLGLFAGLSLVALLRTRAAGRLALVLWAVVSLVIGGAMAWFFGRMQSMPLGLAIGLLLLVLGCLVLVLGLRQRGPGLERPG